VSESKPLIVLNTFRLSGLKVNPFDCITSLTAPTGQNVIAQGRARRRPGAIALGTPQSPERVKYCARKNGVLAFVFLDEANRDRWLERVACLEFSSGDPQLTETD
jgi:hypothetical protein